MRFRRSRGQERQQHKWLVYAAALLFLSTPDPAAARGRGQRRAVRLPDLAAADRSRRRDPAPPALRHRPGDPAHPRLRGADGDARRRVLRERAARRSRGRASRASRSPSRRWRSRRCSARRWRGSRRSSTGASTAAATTRRRRWTRSGRGCATSSTSRCSWPTCAASCATRSSPRTSRCGCGGRREAAAVGAVRNRRGDECHWARAVRAAPRGGPAAGDESFVLTLVFAGGPAGVRAGRCRRGLPAAAQPDRLAVPRARAARGAYELAPATRAPRSTATCPPPSGRRGCRTGRARCRRCSSSPRCCCSRTVGRRPRAGAGCCGCAARCGCCSSWSTASRPGRSTGSPRAHKPARAGRRASGSTRTITRAARSARSSVAAAAALVVRFRRSHGVERQQVKWFAFAASLMAAFLVLASIVLRAAGDEPATTRSSAASSSPRSSAGSRSPRASRSCATGSTTSTS